MKYEFTEERKKYLKSRGKTLLRACPGSGKTTSIAFKLQSLIKECSLSHSNFSGVACLSFTNSAREELIDRYEDFSGKKLQYPHIISTIDGFVNRYIIGPYFYLLNSKVKPRIFLDQDLKKMIDNSDWRWQFKKFKLQNGKPLFYIYPPEKFSYDSKGEFNYKENKNIKSEDVNVFENYRKFIFEWQVKNGFFKNDDITYLALHILKKYPDVAKWLSNRFPVIIIDEAQDTSEIQFEIFEKLVEGGLKNLELIGDELQCLYEWRNASPNLFFDLTRKSADWQVLAFSNCRRSSQNIINCYSLLKGKYDDNKIQSIAKIKKPKPVYVIRFIPGDEVEAVNKYSELCKKEEIKKARVVARGSKMVSKLMGEKDKKLWYSDDAYIIVDVLKKFSEGAAGVSINKLRKLVVRLQNPQLAFDNRREKENELKKDYLFSIDLLKIIKELPGLNTNLEEWTKKSEKYLKEKLSLEEKFSFSLKKGVYERDYNKRVSNILFDETKISAIPVSTIHQIKGLTFDSVMLLLSENRVKGISLEDIFRSDAFPKERQRLIYVAMSRPRNLLAIGVPLTKKFTDKYIKEVLGNDVVII